MRETVDNVESHERKREHMSMCAPVSEMVMIEIEIQAMGLISPKMWRQRNIDARTVALGGRLDVVLRPWDVGGGAFATVLRHGCKMRLAGWQQK